MTPFLQPANVHWNKPFKTAMREKLLNWLAKGEQEFTGSGKGKSVVYKMIARWLSESWNALPSDMIRQSFIQCGILSSESEDLHSRLRLFARHTNL